VFEVCQARIVATRATAPYPMEHRRADVRYGPEVTGTGPCRNRRQRRSLRVIGQVLRPRHELLARIGLKRAAITASTWASLTSSGSDCRAQVRSTRSRAASTTSQRVSVARSFAIHKVMVRRLRFCTDRCRPRGVPVRLVGDRDRRGALPGRRSSGRCPTTGATASWPLLVDLAVTEANPHAKRAAPCVVVRIDRETVGYFTPAMSERHRQRSPRPSAPSMAE
jgi:hypothetical protein